MARLLRYLGWVLLAIAAAFLGHDLVLLLKGGHWDAVSFGQAWGWIHEPSRDGLRGGLEALWPLLGRGVGAFLSWPVWAVFGVPGLLLSLARRRSTKRRRLWN